MIGVLPLLIHPVLQNFTCKAPTTDPAKLRQVLSEPRVGLGAAPVLQKSHLPHSKQ